MRVSMEEDFRGLPYKVSLRVQFCNIWLRGDCVKEKGDRGGGLTGTSHFAGPRADCPLNNYNIITNLRDTPRQSSLGLCVAFTNQSQWPTTTSTTDSDSKVQLPVSHTALPRQVVG